MALEMDRHTRAGSPRSSGPAVTDPAAWPMSGPRLRRRHHVIEHTADVGFRAEAHDPAALLEEAALALAEISADLVDRSDPATEPLEVVATDPEGLVYAWLNELIAMADARGEALVGARALHVQHAGGPWIADGVASFVPFRAGRARSRLQVKAATYHGLRVVAAPEGWTLDVYLDV
jgi:SHS2 domain-containing protein